MTSVRLIKIIKYLIYCLALTPLIITPMTIFPFSLGRGLIIQALVEIIFILYLILAIFNKNYRPKINILTIVLSLFLAALFISSVLGVDFRRSFWSVPERFTGWFYLLHGWAIFLAASAIFRTDRDWKNFLGFNVAVSLPMFGIALLSLFGFKFWGVDLGARISGTLGNPLFLAAYFILIWALAAYLFFIEKNRPLKIIWLSASAMAVFAVFLTQSRGASLGLLAGIASGAVYYGACNHRKKAKIITASIILLLAFAAATPFVFKNFEFVKKTGILGRFSGLSITGGTANTRLMGWRVALRAIKERPLLGWGVENFNAAFNKYYNPQFLKYSYYETWFDKPHNNVLEIAVDGGAAGAALYLSVFGACFYLIREKQKSGRLTLAASAALLGGLAAYFVQNLFVFDTPVSYLLFFILLAFIGRKDGGAAEEDIKIPVFYLLPAAAMAVVAAWIVNISPICASSELRIAVAMPSENGQKIDFEKYKEAGRRFNPYISDWRADLAKGIIPDLRTGGGIYKDEEIFYSLGELQKDAVLHSGDAYIHMLLGEFYAELGTKDKKYFDMAKNELNRALELSPERQHIYFGYARLYAVMKDKENTIKAFTKAIDLASDVPLAYWEGAKHLYVMDEKNPLVSEWLIKTAENGYLPEKNTDFLFMFQNTFQHFFQEKNYTVLYHFFEKMEEIEPNEAKWHAQNATARYLLGDKEEALQEIKRAIELDGSYKTEGEEFIKMIEAGK